MRLLAFVRIVVEMHFAGMAACRAAVDGQDPLVGSHGEVPCVAVRETLSVMMPMMSADVTGAREHISHLAQVNDGVAQTGSEFTGTRLSAVCPGARTRRITAVARIDTAVSPG